MNTLDLSRRGITDIIPGGLSCFVISSSDDDDLNDWSSFANSTMAIDLDHNNLTAVPSQHVFNVFPQCISLQYNNIRTVPAAAFAGYGSRSTGDNTTVSVSSATALHIWMQGNGLEELGSDMLQGFGGEILYLFLDNNSITSLPPRLLGHFYGYSLLVSMEHNGMRSTGAIFDSFNTAGNIGVFLGHNLLTSAGVIAVVDSFTGSPANLTLDFADNLITEVPPKLFENVSSTLPKHTYPSITLLMGVNPIRSFSADAFDCSAAPDMMPPMHMPSGSAMMAMGGCWLSDVCIEISFPSTGPNVAFPAAGTDDGFSFRGFKWRPDGANLRVGLSGTGANLDVVEALYGSNHVALQVNLSHNSIAAVPAGALANSKATVLDLGSNRITQIANDAFGYTFLLRKLVLVDNMLDIISTNLSAAIPSAEVMVGGNAIWALPMNNAKIPSNSSLAAGRNPIQCVQYGPTLQGCACPPAMRYGDFCGYGRCIADATPNGCERGMLFDSLDCSAAPRSVCLAGCGVNEYYNPVQQGCQPLTNCSTRFAAQSGGRLAAYTYRAHSATSDRLCSICSTCEDGYDAVPCTATTNTRCIKDTALDAGAITAIVLAVFIPLMCLAAGVFYFQYSKHMKQELGQKTRYLELTENLLDDVSEEKARMEQAYEIDEADLTKDKVIGTGAYGTVYRGTWGHINVAIKVLRVPMDELNPEVADQFRREVNFMKSIRHPHLLTFYGAGVQATTSQPFLVTELMVDGSLKEVLHDMSREIDWTARITFAQDVAHGVKYLHGVGTVHRDLKAENCFCQGGAGGLRQMRVKVADFGTGRIEADVGTRKAESSLRRRQQGGSLDTAPGALYFHPTPPNNGLGSDSSCYAEAYGDGNNTSAAARNAGRMQYRTMTTQIGSLLWMAPEMLQGERVVASAAPAVDAYSFGIVLFEIWSRQLPWTELQTEGIAFVEELKQRVADGSGP
jgi:Leucine-rich repeat (LRR) protein/tRNA A-37 threonylcarbamoyl transferase component Bud32